MNGGIEQQSTAVILARVSSKAQEDEGYSLDSQVKLLRGYCEDKGLSVVREFKIAETASKEQCRKIFHELLGYLSERNINHLAVEKTDRLTRNFRDAVAIDDWLERDENRQLHAVKENLLLHKNAKSDVKFMWNIHLAVAKKFADNLREEAMKGWAEKLAQGWLPAPPPPGYKTVTEGGKRIHIPDPATRSLIQDVFKLYLSPSQSISSITERMRVIGIRTRFGRPYTKSNVQIMLNNPFYIGINRFNGQDYPGAQEQIISKEVFNAVQQKMHKGRPAVQKQHDPVFKNIIRCQSCGGVVTWQKQKGRFYGACQRSQEACRGRQLLREDRIELLVEAMLRDLVCPSESIVAWVATNMRKQHQSEIERREKMTVSLKSQIARIARMDEMLYDDKLAGGITPQRFTQKHQELMGQKNELEAELSKIDQSGGLRLEQRLVIFQLSQKASGLYGMKSPQQKRLIITKLFKDLTYENGFVSVSYTNFSRAIAEKVRETRILMGAVK